MAKKRFKQKDREPTVKKTVSKKKAVNWPATFLLEGPTAAKEKGSHIYK